MPSSTAVYNQFCKEHYCYSHLKLNTLFFATTLPGDHMLRIHEARVSGGIVTEYPLLPSKQNPNFAIVFSEVWKTKHYIVTHLEKNNDQNGNSPSYSVHCFDPRINRIQVIAQRISHPLIVKRRLITWETTEHSSCIKFFRLNDGHLKASMTISRQLLDKIDVTPCNGEEEKRDGVIEVGNDLGNRSGPLLKLGQFGQLVEANLTYGGTPKKHIHAYLTWEAGPEIPSDLA